MEEPNMPPEAIEMMEKMLDQLMVMIGPMFRQKIRNVLERNHAIVKQDEMSLDFLTEELFNGLMRDP